MTFASTSACTRSRRPNTCTARSPFKRGSNIGCTWNGTKFGSTTCAGTAQPIISANIQSVGTQTGIDLDYLILDSIGGGADRAEYVDYTNTSATVDPLSLEDRDILVATNVQSEDFFMRLDREERALFTSMGIDDGEPAWGYLHDAAGAIQLDDNTPVKFPIVNATMLMTNVFGSNTLASIGYVAPSLLDATGNPVLDANGNPQPIIPAPASFVNICDPTLAPGYKTAYYCATHLDPDCSDPNQGLAVAPVFHAPTDINGNLLLRENGKPLLYGYCGAFQTARG